jgi:hypothetical protein
MFHKITKKNGAVFWYWWGRCFWDFDFILTKPKQPAPAQTVEKSDEFPLLKAEQEKTEATQTAPTKTNGGFHIMKKLSIAIIAFMFVLIAQSIATYKPTNTAAAVITTAGNGYYIAHIEKQNADVVFTPEDVNGQELKTGASVGLVFAGTPAADDSELITIQTN